MTDDILTPAAVRSLVAAGDLAARNQILTKLSERISSGAEGWALAVVRDNLASLLQIAFYDLLSHARVIARQHSKYEVRFYSNELLASIGRRLPRGASLFWADYRCGMYVLHARRTRLCFIDFGTDQGLANFLRAAAICIVEFGQGLTCNQPPRTHAERVAAAQARLREARLA